MQLSYTKLQTYTTCAHKYRRAYVEHQKPPPLASLAWHRNLHKALRHYHEFAKRDGTVQEAALLDAYAHITGADKAPDLRTEPAYQEGEDILRGYCQRENEQKRVPAFLEHTIKFSFGPYTLQGKLDRIDHAPDNHYSIVDYKLDRKKPKADVALDSRQLAFYALLVQEGLGLPVVDVRLYYLRHGLERVHLVNAADPRETLEWIDQTAHAIHADKVWAATEGSHCRQCAFARLCPARNGDEVEASATKVIWQQGSLLWEMETPEGSGKIDGTC